MQKTYNAMDYDQLENSIDADLNVEDLTDEEDFGYDEEYGEEFIDNEVFSDFHDSNYYMQELKMAFNKPKTPYVLLSVNEIIEQKVDRSRSYAIFPQQLVENIRYFGLGFSQKMHTLHFNRKGDYLCGSSATDDAIVLNCWPNLEWHAKINFSGHNVIDAHFLKYSGYSDMIVTTSDDKILHTAILPTGEIVKQHEYKHVLMAHLVVNPQTEYEINSVGWEKDIYLKDIRESCTHLINQHSIDKIRMLHVAHHPLQPEICVCGENNYAYVYDKRNMQRSMHKFGPNNVSFQNFWADTTEYNYLGNEILVKYSKRIADVYKNETSDNPAKYLYRYRGHDWYSANFMGLCSEYTVTTHGGLNAMYNNINFWDKKSEALVNFDFCSNIQQVAVHPKEYVVAYIDDESQSSLLYPDLTIEEPLTFRSMLNRYSLHS